MPWGADAAALPADQREIEAAAAKTGMSRKGGQEFNELRGLLMERGPGVGFGDEVLRRGDCASAHLTYVCE